MPRRNQRHPEPFEPLDLTPQDVNADALQQRHGRRPGESFEQLQRRTELEQRRRQERQIAARINKGIDWSVCLVPGCGHALISYGAAEHQDPFWRDHRVALPLCDRHLAVASAQAGIDANAPLMVDALAKVIETKHRKDAEERATEQRLWQANTYGEIYYVRLNSLIKVGWSRDLSDRLRAYGPDVEVLCHYPASRNDETTLHRQLRPFLAKGREWYEDCQALRDFVKQAIEKHGPPSVAAQWTEPKPAPARPRRRAS